MNLNRNTKKEKKEMNEKIWIWYLSIRRLYIGIWKTKTYPTCYCCSICITQDIIFDFPWYSVHPNIFNSNRWLITNYFTFLYFRFKFLIFLFLPLGANKIDSTSMIIITLAIYLHTISYSKKWKWRYQKCSRCPSSLFCYWSNLPGHIRWAHLIMHATRCTQGINLMHKTMIKFL